MPAPTVPPASGPQPNAPAASRGPTSVSRGAGAQPPQRHAQDQHGADHDQRALAGEQRVAPGAERAGRHRGYQHDQGAAPVDIARIGSGAAELVNSAASEMIGTTGSAPTIGTSTSGISAPVP